jgi:hypothetical protein
MVEPATEPKGQMQDEGGTFEFFVVNISSQKLTGSVSWKGGGRSVSIDVNGLAPGTKSEMKSFSPQGGVTDYWQWSARGRQYQLNIYDGDRYTVVVISDYGIGVLVTSTAPDTWKW